MAEKKITKREKNELIIAVLNGRIPTEDEKNMLIEHITHENELLAVRVASLQPRPPHRRTLWPLPSLSRMFLPNVPMKTA